MSKNFPAQHPKYRIAELLRGMFGELNVKEGATRLATHCGLKYPRTVTTWMKIPAGSSEEINHLVQDRVLSFFGLQTKDQLLTPAHKLSLKQPSTHWTND